MVKFSHNNHFIIIIINSQKKIGPEIFEDYGLQCYKGDLVGVLLEFNKE